MIGAGSPDGDRKNEPAGCLGWLKRIVAAIASGLVRLGAALKACFFSS